jgi:hypothetical protein
VPEAIGSIDDQSNRKARQVSATTSASPNVNLMAKPVAARVSEQGESVSDATQEDESMEIIGQMIQDLFYSDNAKVDDALDAFEDLDLVEDKEKRESLVTAGGCHTLVHLLKMCLDKAIDEFSPCDEVSELNELAELTTLRKTLRGIIQLTLHHGGQVGISSVGGVEAVAKVMKTFPNAKTCSGGCVVPCVIWHAAVLARRKPSKRVEWRFFLQQ